MAPDIEKLCTASKHSEAVQVESPAKTTIKASRDQPQLVNLKQLAATLRLSTHILEHYPEQLYNQIVGRLGKAPYLREMKEPCLRQTSRTFKKPDQSIVRILVGHGGIVYSCAF
jgi:hypothetical protein